MENKYGFRVVINGTVSANDVTDAEEKVSKLVRDRKDVEHGSPEIRIQMLPAKNNEPSVTPTITN